MGRKKAGHREPCIRRLRKTVLLFKNGEQPALFFVWLAGIAEQLIARGVERCLECCLRNFCFAYDDGLALCMGCGDFFDLKLEPDSTILMCSDGLSNMVEDSEIEKIILNQTEELPQKGERLLREANRNGGKDNIAVILVEPFTNEVEKC